MPASPALDRVAPDDRSLRRVALARLTSETGGEAVYFVGIWGRAAYDFEAGPGQLALLAAVVGLCALAAGVAAGVLVDRYGPRRVLMAAESLFVPAALMMAFASSLPALILLTGLATVMQQTVLTAITSFPPLLVTQERALAKANARLELASTFALAVGPAVGAILAGWLGLRAIFVFDAATSIAAVVLVAPVRLRLPQIAAAARRDALGELRAGLGVSYRLPVLRFCLLLSLLVWTSFAAFEVLEPLFFREVLGTGPTAIGWVNTLFGAGLAAGSVLVARWPQAFTSLRAASMLAIASGLGAMLYSGTTDLRIVVIGALAWGIALGVLLPAVRTLIQLHTPEDFVGRAMGVLGAHQEAGQLLPLGIVPLMAVTWGVQPVLIGSGLALTTICLALLGWVKRSEQRAERARCERAGPGERKASA